VTLPLSVILCTRNRAELLQEALLSIIAQDFPQSDYEIVVVDNGSTDRTAEAVRQLQDRAPIPCGQNIGLRLLSLRSRI
jgi:glycosyltransferase involved in cell wall biosynthesis